MSDKNDFGAFLVGFIVGGLTGAAVALLMAPQTGEETRTIIKERAIELKDKAADTYGDVTEKAGVVVSDAKVKAEELKKEAAKTVDELKVKGQSVIDDGKAKVNKLTNKGKPADPEVSIS
jgi:gas vesicle protein